LKSIHFKKILTSFDNLLSKLKDIINMVDKNQILLKFYRECKSKSAISRELKVTRKTVRKYINEHENSTDSIAIEKELELGLSSKPKYNSSTRTKSVLTKTVTEEINFCLKKIKRSVIADLGNS
jgi:hypothetical protein